MEGKQRRLVGVCIAAFICAACIGVVVWTWMRYSYCWDVTPRGLFTEKPPRYDRDTHTKGCVYWKGGFRGRGGYVRIRGTARHHDELADPINPLMKIRVGGLQPDGLKRGVKYVFTGRLRLSDDSGGWFLGGGYRYMMVDTTANRLHPASLAGLVIGVMGCFVFGVALLQWLRGRWHSREGAEEDGSFAMFMPSIRQLMRTPLARPPGRRGIVQRVLPEWCAAGCYALFAVLSLVLLGSGSDLEDSVIMGGGAAYALAWGVMLSFPVGTAAVAFSSERARDTLESLVLTPADHRALVWGRFWHLLVPWVRFLLYMAPVYLAVAGGSMAYDIQDGKWPAGLAFVFGPKVVVALATVDCNGWPGAAVTCTALRALNDLTVLLYVTGVAYFVSFRVKREGTALAWAYGITVASLATVIGADGWLTTVVLVLGSDLNLPLEITALSSMALIVVRVVLPLYLVHRLARKFDRYALGEKAEKQRNLQRL